MTERAVHVTVSGRVQGVGFRAWVEREARARGLSGWVRNRRNGTVEAVLAGPGGDIDTFLRALWRGPPAAIVIAVAVEDHDVRPGAGFRTLPTE
jgi:acylphosphatase